MFPAGGLSDVDRRVCVGHVEHSVSGSTCPTQTRHDKADGLPERSPFDRGESSFLDGEPRAGPPSPQEPCRSLALRRMDLG